MGFAAPLRHDSRKAVRHCRTAFLFVDLRACRPVYIAVFRDGAALACRPRGCLGAAGRWLPPSNQLFAGGGVWSWLPATGIRLQAVQAGPWPNRAASGVEAWREPHRGFARAASSRHYVARCIYA